MKFPDVIFENGRFTTEDRSVINKAVKVTWRICHTYEDARPFLNDIRRIKVDCTKRTDNPNDAWFICNKTTRHTVTMRIRPRLECEDALSKMEYARNIIHEIYHSFLFIDFEKREKDCELEELVVELATQETMRRLGGVRW